MSLKKISKLLRFGGLMVAAAFLGIFVSIEKSDSSRRHSVLLDFNTPTASADVPPGTADSGSSDSGTGSGDSGSGDSGSGDSGSGDCGDGGGE
jgi:hypothetical protein